MEEGQVKIETPAEAPVAQSEPVFKNEEKKAGKGMLIGIIVLAVLAIAGVAFGVYEMMQNSEKDSKISNLEALVGNITLDYIHPIIKSADSSKVYDVEFESSLIYNNEANIVNIVVRDGKVESCALYNRTFEENNDGNIIYKSGLVDNCEVTGIVGNIYKVVEFGSGQMNLQNKIGFIMTDGSIKYIPMYDAVENNDFSVKGSLKIDGYVVDAVNVAVKDIERGYGGYRATGFVLRDGAYLEYDDSMLE